MLYAKNSMKYLHKWLWFIKDRFNPLSYTVMIFAFLGAHYALYSNFINQKVFLGASAVLHLTPLVLATSLFFFKLRLLDEVKDRESDMTHHPERPLPRGLLSRSEVIRLAFIIMTIEVLLFSFYGFPAFLGALIAVGYSLVMYREFFIKNWLRAHLTTYAATHTFVVVFVSLAIFAALFERQFTEIPGELLYFSFAGWFIFNIFEFGRKTFARSEEKAGVDSYSKILGKLRAVLLVVIMAVLGIMFIGKATSPLIINTLLVFLFPIGITGVLYTMIDHPCFAKVYRTLTSLYIIFIYGTIMLTVILKI